jgi:hypothetical protein
MVSFTPRVKSFETKGEIRNLPRRLGLFTRTRLANGRFLPY